MQFDPELYPVQDYKFVASSSLGIIAREYEVTQLVQLLQTMSPDTPMYPRWIESIADHMNLSHREELIESLRQANQPNTEEQQMAQQAQQMQMATQQAQLDLYTAQATESMARARKTSVDTNFTAYEAETDRLKVLVTNLEPGDEDEKEFQRRVKMAELLLKERAIASDEKIVDKQMRENNQ